MNDRKLPADIARCEGRDEGHPYFPECGKCMRKLSPPHKEQQVWIRGWGGHGECPDFLEMDK
jgi:hypothetical protein